MNQWTERSVTRIEKQAVKSCKEPGCTKSMVDIQNNSKHHNYTINLYIGAKIS